MTWVWGQSITLHIPTQESCTNILPGAAWLITARVSRRFFRLHNIKRISSNTPMTVMTKETPREGSDEGRSRNWPRNLATKDSTGGFIQLFHWEELLLQEGILMADCVARWRQSDTDRTVIDWSTPPSACEYIIYTVGILHQDAIKNPLTPKDALGRWCWNYSMKQVFYKINNKPL